MPSQLVEIKITISFQRLIWNRVRTPTTFSQLKKGIRPTNKVYAQFYVIWNLKFTLNRSHHQLSKVHKALYDMPGALLSFLITCSVGRLEYLLLLPQTPCLKIQFLPLYLIGLSSNKKQVPMAAVKYATTTKLQLLNTDPSFSTAGQHPVQNLKSHFIPSFTEIWTWRIMRA